MFDFGFKVYQQETKQSSAAIIHVMLHSNSTPTSQLHLQHKLIPVDAMLFV